jgi:hypothetical protein
LSNDTREGKNEIQKKWQEKGKEKKGKNSCQKQKLRIMKTAVQRTGKSVVIPS